MRRSVVTLRRSTISARFCEWIGKVQVLAVPFYPPAIGDCPILIPLRVGEDDKLPAAKMTVADVERE